MFGASSELVPNMFGASSELAPNMFGASSELASVMEFGYNRTSANCRPFSAAKMLQDNKIK